MANVGNSIDPIVEFPKVEKMLYDLAWKFSRTHGLRFEDARSEAYAGFMKACNNYRPGKGMKFSSWCYFVTWGVLKSHTMRRAGDPLCSAERCLELEEEIVGAGEPTVPRRVLELLDATERQPISNTIQVLFREAPRELWEATEDLSEVAEELFFLFAETPAELNLSRNKGEQVAQIKKHLAAKHGPQKIEKGFRELRNRLGETLVVT